MAGMLSYVVSGRIQAATTSSLFAVASLKLPPLSYLSGAVIGVMTLRFGVTEGALMIAGSGLIAGLICWMLFATAIPVLAFAAATWVPVWLLALLLRASASQGAMLAGATAIGVAIVFGFHLLLGEPAMWWRDAMSGFLFDNAERAGMVLDAEQKAQLQGLIDVVSPHMSGLVAGGTVLGLALTVMLARWWQATLDNPGGFGREFRALRLPRQLVVAAGVLLVLAVLADAATGGVAGDVMWTVLVAFVLQGLSVVHAVVAGRPRSGVWLAGVYLLLALLTLQAALLLAMVGFSDEWLGLRRRFARDAT